MSERGVDILWQSAHNGRCAASDDDGGGSVSNDDGTAPALDAYDRSALSAGIVHFGVGGFHRAHQAVYLDDLFRAGQAADWAIVGVGTMPGDARMRDALAAQDHLYTLVVKHPDGRTEPRTIGSIIDFTYAPDDPEAVLGLLADPAIRIVSLTITEGGYHVHSVTGDLDTSDPDLAADLGRASPPRTVFGYLAEGLRRRRDAGIDPFTIASCDNVPENGDVARKMITAFATILDPALGEWIAATVPFPNSMVDRITPVTTDDDVAALKAEHHIVDAWPVVCEPFRQWVLEDSFVSGRPPLEDAGVHLVDDVEPYELMKLRLLNGTHQAMAYLGCLAGLRYAHEACQDEELAAFLRRYMADEAAPTVPEVPGIDLAAYQDTLIDRFSSPAVKDTLARLAAETSDRIPKFVLPVITARLRAGLSVDAGALLVASWARYAEGVDDAGEPIDVVDRKKDALQAAAASHDSDILAFLRDADLFGSLAEDARFTEPYAAHLHSLRRRGARATLRTFLAG